MSLVVVLLSAAAVLMVIVALSVRVGLTYSLAKLHTTHLDTIPKRLAASICIFGVAILVLIGAAAVIGTGFVASDIYEHGQNNNVPLADVILRIGVMAALILVSAGIVGFIVGTIIYFLGWVLAGDFENWWPFDPL
jgi:hypothetical protein